MTALKDYEKWDRIIAQELTSSSDDSSNGVLPKHFKKQLSKLSKQKHKDNKNAKDLYTNKSKNEKPKKQKQKKKKKNRIKIQYDPMNIPRYSLIGLLRDNFSPLSRLITNSIHPGSLCGNLIHYHYISSFTMFVFLYIVNVLFLFRVAYFGNINMTGMVIIYYLHFIKRLFHWIIDIPLAIFHSKIKDSNHVDLKRWRLTYLSYSIFVLILCSISFHIISSNGPKLTFTQYIKTICFIRNENALDKIEQISLNPLWHDLINVVVLSTIVDAIYIGLLIYNAADFKKFKRSNIMLYFTRYCAALMRPIIIEVTLSCAVYLLKDEDDPTFFDVLGKIKFNATMTIFFVLSVSYVSASVVTKKFERWTKSKVSKKKDK